MIAPTSVIEMPVAAPGIAERPADVVCSPQRLGAARPTRHSFGPSMLRRARRQHWQVEVERWRLDADGCGEVVYRVDAEGHVLRFVVFSQVIGDDERTDRVIAERWDVCAALILGSLPDERLADLREQVPRQEYGLADSQTLVWTRANRSQRHFQKVVERLACGGQPDRAMLGHSSYVLRSTAYYANGKFGMAGYERLSSCPPVSAPYRAQMLAAWLLREFSCDLVEHMARQRSASAVPLAAVWRRAIGIGNATGLGMVPFPVNHPELVHTWCTARELALTRARAATADRVAAGAAAVRQHLRTAGDYFTARAQEPYAPFCPGAELAEQVLAIARQAEHARDWNELWGWAETVVDVEAQELLLSCLIEELTELDAEVEQHLHAVPAPISDQTATVGALLADLEQRYGWALQLARADGAARNFWYYAADSEEPRRGRRGQGQGEPVAMAVGIPTKIAALHEDLAATAGSASVAGFLLLHPEHRQAAQRVLQTRALRYGEPRVNLEAPDLLPLQLQRFQLAWYGAENFIPQSTEWLRVTLMQGAPSRHELVRYGGSTNPIFFKESSDES